MALIGVQLGILKPFNVQEGLEFIRSLKERYGFDAVEINLEGSVGTPAIFRYEDEYKNIIKEKLKGFTSIGVHLPFFFLNPLADYAPIADKSMDELKACIDYAIDIGANYAIVHTSGWSFSKKGAEIRELWRVRIAQLLEYIGERNLIISIENTGHFLSLNLLANLVRSFNSQKVKITLDTGHASFRIKNTKLQYIAQSVLDRFLPLDFIIKNMSYEQYGSLENFFAKEIALINNIHLHDYNGKQDHICVGDGKINFSFLKYLKDTSIPIIIETHFLKLGFTPNEGVERSVGFLRKHSMIQ